MITGTVGVSPLRLLDPGRMVGEATVVGPGLFLVELRVGTARTTGLVAAMDVLPVPAAGGLYPHELTDPKAVRRRLSALRHARVDQDPVMLTYRGRGDEVGEARANCTSIGGTTTGDGSIVVSRVGAAVTARLLRSMAGRTYLVADGHHRLAAAAELAQSGGPVTVTGFVVDADDSALTLSSIHRVLLDVNGRELVPGSDVDATLAAFRSSGGQVRGPLPRTPGTDQALPRGLTLLHGPRMWQVQWLDRSAFEIAWLVERTLDQVRQRRVRRELHAPSAVGAADHGALTVMLPDPVLDELIADSRRGELLPQKTTLFEPKLPSGTLVRPLEAP